jgi:hypothetical protein
MEEVMDETQVKIFIGFLVENCGKLVDDNPALRFPEWVRFLAVADPEQPVAVMEEFNSNEHVNRVLQLTPVSVVSQETCCGKDGCECQDSG